MKEVGMGTNRCLLASHLDGCSYESCAYAVSDYRYFLFYIWIVTRNASQQAGVKFGDKTERIWVCLSAGCARMKQRLNFQVSLFKYYIQFHLLIAWSTMDMFGNILSIFSWLRLYSIVYRCYIRQGFTKPLLTVVNLLTNAFPYIAILVQVLTLVTREQYGKVSSRLICRVVDYLLDNARVNPCLYYWSIAPDNVRRQNPCLFRPPTLLS